MVLGFLIWLFVLVLVWPIFIVSSRCSKEEEKIDEEKKNEL